ncbi:tRNA preQ1(34) S-adenosylmethionine ribosyltransferase-isomerase QueA [Sinimarinibacterium sp. CAU 1509]|uniref:tRNA preQ1(34) S-adenosylmethionine ribosyltransferase-isomerase QueA n=1 Tax=Sinimarinibacterium sp. CAU 1509 TaxID=2562283 RepID=UPI0010ACA9DC|nr:tRNA preQ1(34) S-adenosylmethionine ribosyltransferase-isomerase QueA [Sinimarinibacterium sp. CAU 1509]TJY61077.1 tRNA preQ1(34) S-adenosylmethionine ribosyltransferase-isomerase QueA [Sinimarinibacterium sp. CAU 1509]
MRRSDFQYSLPEELIAQRPAEQRSNSRLLRVGPGALLQDRMIAELPELLDARDLLVFNDTRVIPARVFGHKPTGGRVEILVERILDERRFLAQLGVSKKPRAGTLIIVGEDRLEVLGRDDDLFELSYCDDGGVQAFLERAGQLPLPPYIRHQPDRADLERYQTVFAREPGAVAAPTAGLHFDPPLFERLAQRGIETAMLTLHVGAGTFQPVRVDDLSEHRMHAERFHVGAALCAKIEACRARGGRVVAVGTTVARALESAALAQATERTLSPASGETQLFITPGFHFRIVDVLLTNFHLPESTLLMLVSAFAGYERVMAAYRHAVEQRYRFFSYGDAMLIDPSEAGVNAEIAA